MKKIILVSALFLTFLLSSAQVVLAVPNANSTDAQWKAYCDANNCCGVDTRTKDYSCIDKSKGTDCQASYCSQIKSPDILCCAPKGAATGKPQGASTGGTDLPNPLGAGITLEFFVARIINYVLGFVGTISLLLFVYGGIIWMTSAGSSEKVKKGRDIIVWAIIGMAVIFMSYIAVKFVIQGLQGTMK